MSEARATDVVERYLEAIRQRDFTAARACLADKGFAYLSPIARFDDPTSFIANTEHVGTILHRMQTRWRFAEGDRVCHVLDITVNLAEYRTQTVVHLAEVSGQRISRIETVFDATDYHRMFNAGQADV